MLTLKLRLPSGIEVTGQTTNGRLRLRYGRKPAVKPPSVPVVVERTAVLVVPVPVRETIFVAPPPGPTAEEIAYAILQELDGLGRLASDLGRTEEEVSRNGQETGYPYAQCSSCVPIGART